ncbi:mechanosensitive ion channel domain-containing protein [Robiginitalea sp. IMCC44478]|uniref:mechanosensitive ion channel domain-containing protein n=1 Tax=Robiginitalea sp. IMCC44478 TaxID=3459122 RepID=UPI004041C596
MEEFWQLYQNEILSTLICMAILFVTRLVSIQTIKRIGRISDLNKLRTRLIIKYVVIGHSLIFIAALLLIWGVNIKDLGLILSSVFAIIGVALFASWSILSNVTAGVILFFSFPFKIGDRIRIMDKDLDSSEDYMIEDIKAYHLHLRKRNGELITYPNNLMLQKAVTVLNPLEEDQEGTDAI